MLCRTAQPQPLRFDAYQGPAGAGPFYVKCGYTLRHSNEFRGVALDYYESRPRLSREGAAALAASH